MPEEFLPFHSFSDQESATAFAEELEKSGIPVETSAVRSMLDANWIGTSANPVITLKIASVDFEKANLVLDTYYKELAATIDSDYYLFSFSNQELFEIAAKPDEWGHLD